MIKMLSFHSQYHLFDELYYKCKQVKNHFFEALLFLSIKNEKLYLKVKTFFRIPENTAENQNSNVFSLTTNLCTGPFISEISRLFIATY